MWQFTISPEVCFNFVKCIPKEREKWRHFLGRFQIENVSNSSHQFLNTSNHFVNGTETSFNSVPSNFVWSSGGLTYPKSPKTDDKDVSVNVTVDEDEDETKDFLSDKYASISEGSAWFPNFRHVTTESCTNFYTICCMHNSVGQSPEYQAHIVVDLCIPAVIHNHRNGSCPGQKKFSTFWQLKLKRPRICCGIMMSYPKGKLNFPRR